MNCEIRYYVRTIDGISVYLGCMGKKASMQEINSSEWQQSIVSQYEDFLGFHPQFVPEENSGVTFHTNVKKDGSFVMSLWLAASDEPIPSCTYFGINPEEKNWQVSWTAHCWDLYLGADFSSKTVNLVMLLNEIRKYIKVTDGHLIRFMMYMDDLYTPPYIYGYLRPLFHVQINKEALEKCPDDCYPLEITNTYSGNYFALKKSKFNHDDVIRVEDLIELV